MTYIFIDSTNKELIEISAKLKGHKVAVLTDKEGIIDGIKAVNNSLNVVSKKGWKWFNEFIEDTSHTRKMNKDCPDNPTRILYPIKLII